MEHALATAVAHALGTATTPLPLIDDFLVNYNVGQALLVGFALSVLGTLVVGSRKVVALTVLVFGLVFAITPGSMAPVHYRFFGLGLLVLAPVLYVSGGE